MISQLRRELASKLEEILEISVGENDIFSSEFSDLSSTIAFKIGKEIGENPVTLAEKFRERIERANIELIERVESLNGYLNFFLNYELILTRLWNEILEKKENYGKGMRRKEKIILEHTSINPSGPVHVGRLRNSLIGDALSRILKFYGYEVETHYYVNDIGKQIAMITMAEIWNIKPDPEVVKSYKEYAEKNDFKVFFTYVSANRLYEKDEKFREEVDNLIKRAELGDRKALAMIKSVAKKCLDGQKKIYEILGINFDFYDFESNFIETNEVFNVIEKLKQTKFWRKADFGEGLDLSSFGIERASKLSVLLRKDGTTTYLARDIAYHLYKMKLGDLLLNVLGEDHKLEFQELKTILEKILNLEKKLEAVHFSFVNFQGLQMSTREGRIFPVDKLIDLAIEKAKAEIRKRGKGREADAALVGIGAIKYHLLKTSPMKPINFSWKAALNFEGDSAPYIQYAHARCCSILKKEFGEDSFLEKTLNFLSSCDPISASKLEENEKKLILQILRFPEVIENSAKEYKPNILANYLYDLSYIFNKFYYECPVLKSEKKIKCRRLFLVYTTKLILANGLYLLGIKALDVM